MKVLCPSCGKLIDVASKEVTTFCNECGSNFPTERGVETLQKKYKSLQEAAYRDCFQKNQYDSAIEYYEEALAIRPNDFSSIVGIILCKLYSQTFDKPNFNLIEKTIESYDVYLDHENTFIFLSFLKDVIKQTKVFNEEGLTRLRNEGRFLNVSYRDYYINGMKDALESLKFLKSAIPLLSEEEKNEFLADDDVLKELDITIEFVEKHVSETFEVEEEQNQSVIEDLRVIDIDEDAALLKYKTDLIVGGIVIVLLIGILIGASFDKSGLAYIALLIPIAIGGIYYLINKFYIQKKHKDNR